MRELSPELTAMDTLNVSRGPSVVPRFGSAMRLAVMSLVLSGDVAEAQTQKVTPAELGKPAVVKGEVSDRLSLEAEDELKRWESNESISHFRHPERDQMIRRVCKNDALRKKLADSIGDLFSSSQAAPKDRTLSLEVLAVMGGYGEVQNVLPGILANYQIHLANGDSEAWKHIPLMRKTVLALGIRQEDIDTYMHNPCDPLPRTVRRVANAFMGPVSEYMPVFPPPLLMVLHAEQKQGANAGANVLKGFVNPEGCRVDRMTYLCLLTHYGNDGLKAIKELGELPHAQLGSDCIAALSFAWDENTLPHDSLVEEFLCVVADTKQCVSRRDAAFYVLLKAFPKFHERVSPVIVGALGSGEKSSYAVNALRDALIAHPGDTALIQDLLRVVRTKRDTPAGAEALRVFALAGRSCPKAAGELQIIGMEEWNTLPTEQEIGNMDTQAKAAWEKRVHTHISLATAMGKTMKHATDEQKMHGTAQLQSLVLPGSAGEKRMHPDSRVRYSAVRGLAAAGTSSEEFFRKVAGTHFGDEVSGAVRTLFEEFGAGALERLVQAYPDNGLVKLYVSYYLRK